MSLNDQVSAIDSREDFVSFLRELRHDLRTRSEEWENVTLEAYLEALAAWAEDAEGYYANQGGAVPKEPSWKMVGELFLAARVYE